MVLRRGSLWLVLMALVLAQAIGLMHRVVHAPRVAVAHGAAAQSEAVPGHIAHESHGPAAGSWIGHLFAGHDDGSCRLFDLFHNDGLPVPAAQSLPAAVVQAFIDFFQGEFLARWAALYDARGPPSLR